MSLEPLIFWTAAALLVYTHLGYPFILYFWGTLYYQPYQRKHDHRPTVSILAVAYNESHNVSGRIDNLLELDYPKDRLEIILASDGSTDDTVERARRYSLAGIRVIEFTVHRGKPAVLNNLIPQASGNIIVLTDMRQRFEPSALVALIAPFADASVGAVTGELILTGTNSSSAAGEGVGFYWKYEKFIRRYETFVDSTIGVTGAIYAVRRDLFRTIKADTLIDDVLIPMLIVRQGYRVIYEPAARAYDNIIISAGKESARKIRTIAGNFQLLIRERWLINPAANRLWLQTVSHKFCRLFSPLCLVAVLLANLALLSQPAYQWLLILQIIFYSAAVAGYLNEIFRRRIPFVNVPYAFCLLNWATVMAFFRFISGRQTVTWK